MLAEAARAEAAERDARADTDDPGPLHGVPVAVKEEIDVAGAVTTFGGEANHTPAAADAEVVRRLRAAGAVVVGKTAMPEFGAYPYTESVSRGLTRNPWDRTRSPGGSSGGSAVAVATGMVPVALGGDGGGSIRVPAAWCGVFGLKPRRGRVSTAPWPHLWWMLGTCGPLTRSVRESAVVYDVISGSMPTDRFPAATTPAFTAAVDRDPGRLRIGWSLRSTSPGIRPHRINAAAVHDTVQLLSSLGHQVREVDPGYPDPTALFMTQYLASIRTEAGLVERPELLERRTRTLCRMGAWVTPRVLDRAFRATETLSGKVNRVFDDTDVLITPVTANRPPRVGVLGGIGVNHALVRSMPAVTYTALWNLAGNPAASVPRGLGPDGLPLAVQLVGRTDDEPTLISLAAQIEAAEPWPTPDPGD